MSEVSPAGEPVAVIKIGLVRKAEIRRHDADDAIGPAVQLQRAAECISASRK